MRGELPADPSSRANATAGGQPLYDVFPRSIIIVAADEAMWREPASAAEEEFVGRAVVKRQREFRAGRACARKALTVLGFPFAVLPVGPLGAPLWPAGATGSISHCDNRCAAAVARVETAVALGFDIERRRAARRELRHRICRPEELAWISRAKSRSPEEWLTIFFSAKESVYKCVSPIIKNVLDFHDIRLLAAPRPQQFSAVIDRRCDPLSAIACPIDVRYAVSAGYVYTGACLPTL